MFLSDLIFFKQNVQLLAVQNQLMSLKSICTHFELQEIIQATNQFLFHKSLYITRAEAFWKPAKYLIHSFTLFIQKINTLSVVYFMTRSKVLWKLKSQLNNSLDVFAMACISLFITFYFNYSPATFTDC